jgi:hypothetical protein
MPQRRAAGQWVHGTFNVMHAAQKPDSRWRAVNRDRELPISRRIFLPSPIRTAMNSRRTLVVCSALLVFAPTATAQKYSFVITERSRAFRI